MAEDRERAKVLESSHVRCSENENKWKCIQKDPFVRLCPFQTLVMLVLHSSEDLEKLEKVLAQNAPESLRVCGTVFHINRGNPFKMEALVDSWPEFKTVICKPQASEMVNDLDICTNMYLIFTKDPENLREVLQTSDAINWNQCFQIEALQSDMDDVITSIAASKDVDVKRHQAFLYVRDIYLRDSEKNLNENTKNSMAVRNSSALKAEEDQPAFPISPLSDADAELVNEHWIKGGTEMSLQTVRRCITQLPSLCMRGPGGEPISWYVMDQTAEMRMAYTLPEYRRRGLATRLLKSFMTTLLLRQEDFPFYFITDEHNVQAQGVAVKVGLLQAQCGYFQWICRPSSNAP